MSLAQAEWHAFTMFGICVTMQFRRSCLKCFLWWFIEIWAKRALLKEYIACVNCLRLTFRFHLLGLTEVLFSYVPFEGQLGRLVHVHYFQFENIRRLCSIYFVSNDSWKQLEHYSVHSMKYNFDSINAFIQKWTKQI